MSLHPQVLCPIPEETARVARAAYVKRNLYMRIRDELGTIYQDEAFAHLFPRCGQPAEAPWRLLLVCLMQFAEGFSDWPSIPIKHSIRLCRKRVCAKKRLTSKQKYAKRAGIEGTISEARSRV